MSGQTDDNIEVSAGIGVAIDSLRARHAAAIDDARRNLLASVAGMERELFKDPYLLDALGLEPLDGDPTIEQVGRGVSSAEADNAAE